MGSNSSGRPPRNLSESVIRNAMKHSQSNLQASRYLNITIETYRKYAKMYVDQATGKTLYDLHKNEIGKGIKKAQWKKEIPIEKINEIMASESYRSIDQEKLKARLLYEGILKSECYKCHHNEKRAVDFKQPLILSFKDGNKHHWQIHNLEMLCYNCYFLYVGNLFTEKQVRALEDAHAPLVKDQIDWKVDDNFLRHFQDIGLEEKNDYYPGEEFISKI